MPRSKSLDGARSVEALRVGAGDRPLRSVGVTVVRGVGVTPRSVDGAGERVLRGWVAGGNALVDGDGGAGAGVALELEGAGRDHEGALDDDEEEDDDDGRDHDGALGDSLDRLGVAGTARGAALGVLMGGRDGTLRLELLEEDELLDDRLGVAVRDESVAVEVEVVRFFFSPPESSQTGPSSWSAGAQPGAAAASGVDISSKDASNVVASMVDSSPVCPRPTGSDSLAAHAALHRPPSKYVLDRLRGGYDRELRQVTPALRAQALSKVWPGSTPITALRDVHFTVAAGEVVTLVGPNASGKSTLLAVAAGLLRPSAGAVWLYGTPATQPGARARLGYLPEHSPAPGRRRVREWVVLAARLSGLDAATATTRADQAVECFGLADVAHQRIDRLSYGLRRMAALAQALVHAPSLALLDEPLTGLDEPARDRVLTWIERARDEGTAVVVATHHRELFTPLSPSLAKLRNGHLVVRA